MSAQDAQWLEVCLETSPEKLEALCAQLTRNGMAALSVEDGEDFRRFVEENSACWSDVDEDLAERMKNAARVKFYVTDDAPGREQLARYLSGITLPYTASRLRENDWAHSWQKYYRPMEIGPRLYIVPEWERGCPVPPNRTPLYLDPGLAFGTGSHASTRLCLDGLQECSCQGADVLDLGCGSGILSIAALKLGAASALAADIDPKAADVAVENAALNGLGPDVFTARAGNILEDEPLRAALAEKRWGVIFANIVADVIIPLAPFAARCLAPDGVFLTSGIIDTREEEVRAALSHAGLAITDRREHKGWVCLTARHPAGKTA